MSRHRDSDSRNFAGKLLSSGLVLFMLSLVGVQVGLPFVANAISIVVSIAICGAALVFWIGVLGGDRRSADVGSTDASSPQDVERFGISLTFPGERRSIVGQVAEQLASELGISFSDADRKLFESDQALGGHRHSLFSMAIYIVGSGLASLLKQSSASERLLHQLARRLTEIADIPHPVDLSQIELLYAACQRRDRAEAARLLGAEFYD